MMREKMYDLIVEEFEPMSCKNQIEELARAIYESGVAIDGIDCAFAAVHGADREDSHFMRMAAHLYQNGYRKASDVAAEIFAEIDKIMPIVREYAPICVYRELVELKKKYTEDGE